MRSVLMESRAGGSDYVILAAMEIIGFH
uniref:Uncharacterized protein n=1 Tax=Anguilla anguilla TaxID=7936 RepID=A0A0E9QXZ6_ANGAN